MTKNNSKDFLRGEDAQEVHEALEANSNQNLTNESPDFPNEDNYGDNNGSEGSQNMDY